MTNYKIRQGTFDINKKKIQNTYILEVYLSLEGKYNNLIECHISSK